MSTTAMSRSQRSTGDGPAPARDATPLPARTWLARLVELFALVPPVAMLIEVWRAPRLQFVDYWYTIARFTDPDGSLDPMRMLVLSNEHPVALPSLAYWVNAQLFDGDNRTLGVFVVVVAGLTVLAMRAALPASLPPLMRASLVVAASGIIFSLHGIWNFARAMSGTAWLTANLLVVVALLLASRGRWSPAWLSAAAACLSYGTGFAVWPALALLAFLRREPIWRRALPLVVGAGIVIAWVALSPRSPSGPAPAGDIGTVAYNFLILTGHIWTADNGGIAAIAGAIMLGLYAAMATTKVAREPQLRVWWALALHAFIGCGMIALARIDGGPEFGMQSRYTSLSVLMSIPLIVLLARLAQRAYSRQAHRIAIAGVLVGVLGFLLGSPAAAQQREEVHVAQTLKAIAMRGGFSEAFSRLPAEKDLIPRLKSMGHYPFTSDFTLGCGGPELGAVLDVDAMSTLDEPSGNKRPATPVGEVNLVEQRVSATRVVGWAVGAGDPVRCVVLADRSGRITGGGVTEVNRQDVLARIFGISPNVGFEAIGPVEPGTRVVVIQRGGAMRWLPPVATAPVPATDPDWDETQ